MLAIMNFKIQKHHINKKMNVQNEGRINLYIVRTNKGQGSLVKKFKFPTLGASETLRLPIFDISESLWSYKFCTTAYEFIHTLN